MALTALLGGTALSASGISSGDVVDVGKKVGDFIGIDLGFLGGNENKGQSSLVDALDNFERISTAEARAMVPEIEKALRNGATDREIANITIRMGGNPGNATVENRLASYKWDLIRPFLQRMRTQIQREGTTVAGFSMTNIIILALTVGGAYLFAVYGGD